MYHLRVVQRLDCEFSNWHSYANSKTCTSSQAVACLVCVCVCMCFSLALFLFIVRFFLLFIIVSLIMLWARLLCTKCAHCAFTPRTKTGPLLIEFFIPAGFAVFSLIPPLRSYFLISFYIQRLPAKYNDLFIELNRMELSSYDSLEHSTLSSDVGYIDQVYLIAISRRERKNNNI